jgi:hypothetical protein
MAKHPACAAVLAALTALSGCISWSERGTNLLVTDDGKVFFEVLNRVVEEKGCEKNIHCSELVQLMDHELKLARKCPGGHLGAQAMPVRGYVQITARCRAPT